MYDDRGFMVAEIFGKLISAGLLAHSEAVAAMTIGAPGGDYAKAEAKAIRMLETAIKIHEAEISDAIRLEIAPLIKSRSKPDILEAVAHAINQRRLFPLPVHVVKSICVDEVKAAMRRSAARG